MSIESFESLLKLYRNRLENTREIMATIDSLPRTDVEAAAAERMKWEVREGQERAMIDRLERRLGVKPDDEAEVA